MTIEIEHKRVVFDDDIASWLKQYSDAQTRIKEWQEIADIARSHLESALGDAEVGMYNGNEVVRWSFVESKRIDVKKARERQKKHAVSHKDANISQSLLLATFFLHNLAPTLTMPPRAQHFAVHLTGTILLPENQSIEAETLFDSGCIGANYMSRSFYNKHTQELAPYTQTTDARVFLGDFVTSMPISLLLDLSI